MKQASQTQYKLLHGDCTVALRQLPDQCIDLVVTDPPYLVNYRSRTGESIMNDRDDQWLKPSFVQIARVLKDNGYCVSFYGWNHAEKFIIAWRSAGLSLVGHFVWSKAYASSRQLVRAQHECAYLLAKGQPRPPQELLNDVLPWSYTGNKLHPTQKPVSAIEPVIGAFSKPGEVVLDPFMGSGTTGEAAQRLGRRFVGIELDRRYFDVAKQRLEGLY